MMQNRLGIVQPCNRRRLAAQCALLALIAIVAFGILFCVGNDVALAKEDDVEKQLEDGVSTTIDALDLDEFEKYLNSLSERQKNAVNIEELESALKSLANGNGRNFFDTFTDAVAGAASGYFFGFFPTLMIVVVISVMKSVLVGMTSQFVGDSTNEVVHFVCYAAVVVLVITSVEGVVESVTDTINGLGDFAAAVFPILLTLLSALGGVTSVAVYQPFMAALSGGIITLVGAVVLPAFTATLIFSAVGNISKTVKLEKLAKLIRTSVGWLLGVAFGLFVAFLSAQGIAGGVTDRLSFNAAKFALSSYVPILGGYLSDGFDLVGASVVLVKNAFGLTGVAVLCAVVLFPLLKTVALVTALRLTAAIVEPIGDDRVAALCSSTAKNLSLLVTALLGVGFMFFVLVMLVVGSCNLGV